MSVLAPEPQVAASPSSKLPSVASEGEFVVPAWISDLATFRAWCLGPDYPERGQVDFLDGEIWVDLSMEKFFAHNQVRGRVGTMLASLIDSEGLGYFVPDRMRLVHPEAGLSCEPDAAFFSFDAVRSGQVKLSDSNDVLEIVGSPEMVLEVVSDSSVRKDTKLLPPLYHRAEIREYWLIDVRETKLAFNLFRHAPEAYTTDVTADGWSRSGVFGREFRLTRGTDPLGNPLYNLEVR